MPEKKPYTRREKLDLLDAYADALANNPDHIEVWLEVLGVTSKRLAEWRAEQEAGRLTGDEAELPTHFAEDGSIAALAQLYRAHITQVRPGTRTVPVDSAAGLVIYDTDGNWRLDYLARARSALKAVITVATAAPEKFLRPNASTSTKTAEAPAAEETDATQTPLADTPADAVAKVRAAWGIDRFPVLDRPTRPRAGQEVEDALAAAKAREAADRRMTRWTDQLAGNPLAYDALRDWYRRQEQPKYPLPPSSLRTPPTWEHADPTTWPPDGEGQWLDEMARHLLGETLPLARLGDDRQRIIVLRRTVETISDYIRDNSQLTGAKFYYQHHVVRPWQWYSMEDLRTPEERMGTVKSTTRDKAIIAAIAAMALHTVLRDWDPKAAEATFKRAFDMFQAFSPTAPEQNYRQRAVTHRMQQARLPQLQVVATPNHPEFIRNVSERVAELFYESELLRMAPGRVMAGRYLAVRRVIQPHDKATGNGNRVIQLADYAANLAVASPAVRKKLGPGQLLELRQMLLNSTAGDPLQAAARRNDALAMQKSSYDGALTEALRGLNLLKQQRGDGAKVERDQLIMEEQLCMNLAGSAVQWLEHLLGGDPEWQKTIEPRQWMLLTNFALHEANRAVEIIEQLHGGGELTAQRYADRGFLADENFVYRAWDILYRCICAATTVAVAFPSKNKNENVARQHDFPQALDQAHLAITTIDKPIAVSELPRLLHSMLWHTFLAGGVLPALKPDTLNGSLVNMDALTRVLTPEEIADPNCETVMTYTRIALITDWLIQRGWTAGAMGLIQPGSRVWDVLDDRSGGLYSVWREQFDGLLLTSRDKDVPQPPREKYSFHERIAYPGDRKLPEQAQPTNGGPDRLANGPDENGESEDPTHSGSSSPDGTNLR